MTILAFEFSSRRRSVALVKRKATGSAELMAGLAEDGSANLGPLKLVHTALEQAGVRPGDIERIVVGLGPGSYTGIRSAIAVAQGWQLARGIQTIGVSSVECLALQAQMKGWFGQVAIVVDAQRNEVYLATYRISENRRELTERLRLATADQARAIAAQPATVVVGPEATQWIPDARVLFPDAAALAQLASGGTAFEASETLEPIYLREAKFVKAPTPRPLPP
jgi:tRNA threonylcarbamoyl adenosine modification protein YeaZ